MADDPIEFLHQLPLGIWVARVPGGELAYANAAFGEIMGMGAREDVAVGGYSEPYGICDRSGRPYPEERMPFVQALRAQAPVVVDDIVIHRGDGRRVNVRAFAKPIFDAAGTMTHVVIAFTDISAEVTAMREKDVAQERLQVALDHAPVVLFVYDKDGLITLAEGSAMPQVRAKRGEIVGRSTYEAFADVPEIVENARLVLEGGRASPHAVRMDGLAFETLLTPIRDGNGVVTGALGIANDVTERVQTQSKIVQTDRMVSLGTLAAGVAHELNNPLANLLSSLSAIDDVLLLLGEDLDRVQQGAAMRKRMERLQLFASQAREGAERLRVITRDLRSFSRVDEARHPVDVRAAVESALHLVSKTLEARAKLATELDATPLVDANESRIAQVVVNLAINAAQAIPEGAPRDQHEIRIATRMEQGAAVIEVSDTGPGVPLEIRPRLFEPFFTTKESEGTGLGLFVSDDIVKALGGTIEIGDRAGGGALFRVRLPASDPAATRAPAAAPERTRSLGGRPRVLVIEDDRTLGDLMRGALVAECEVRVASTGEDGVALVLGQPWDLVLCDLMLGDMTGMDVHERIRKERPGRERSLVFMTGGTYTAEARKFLATVANDRLEKPFDVQTEVRRRLR